MSALQAGATIGMLGGGQLGRMMASAAAQLGFDVSIYCPERDCPAARVAAHHAVGDYRDTEALLAWAKTCDVVTYEFENVHDEAAQALIDAGIQVRPGAKALEVSQDRWVEKSFLRDCGIATADFAEINSADEVESLLKQFGGQGVLKTRRDGYDGKGQARLETGDDYQAAHRALGFAPCILEAMIPFEREVSVIIARDEAGDWNPYVGRKDLARVYGPQPGQFGLGREAELETYTDAARHAAGKHQALPVVGDAKIGLKALTDGLKDHKTPEKWVEFAQAERTKWTAYVQENVSFGDNRPNSYAQAIGVVNAHCHPRDRVVAAAGGLPAEVTANWRTLATGTVDVEFGFSCMGYEISGAWGARIAQAQQEPERDTITFVGDGSYLMMNSDIYSSVLTDKKLIILLLDNGGFAVINKLQNNTGNESFNNLIADCPTVVNPVRVDFEAHAAAMGAEAEAVAAFATATGIANASAQLAVGAAINTAANNDLTRIS